MPRNPSAAGAKPWVTPDRAALRASYFACTAHDRRALATLLFGRRGHAVVQKNVRSNIAPEKEGARNAGRQHTRSLV